MRLKASLIPLLFVIIYFAFSAGAQERQGVATSGAQTGSLDNLGVKDYLLGPGDELDIKFFEQPALNTTATLSGAGTITLPFIDGALNVACKTDVEVGKMVTTAYTKLFKNPQISVRVTGRFSRPAVAVYGAVRDPQRIQALRKAKLNEILSFAGGPTEKANGMVQVVHTARPVCADSGDVDNPEVDDLYNLSSKVATYKISDLVLGVKEANPYIRPGDIVTVMEAEPLYIVGSVYNPSSLYLKPGMGLQRALAMVGGPTREAKETAIVIYRRDSVTGEAKANIIADFNAIRKGKSPDIRLEPYDIIEVPRASAFSPKLIGDTLSNAALAALGAVVRVPVGGVPVR
jgi:polysaccharide export outer membrane protein